MAYNETLADRVREALADAPRVEEKKMFRGLAFMVNGKMCVTIGADDIMCRVDPLLHDSLVEQRGCRGMQMKGREYKGYVRVSEDVLKTKRQLDYWVGLALDFNPKAKASPKKKK